MLKERLTPCASLLYHWFKNCRMMKGIESLNLANFQAWSGEFLNESVSEEELDQAFMQLLKFGLVTYEDDEVRVMPINRQSKVKVKPLPQKIWKMPRLSDIPLTGGLVIASTLVMVISAGFVLFQNPSVATTEADMNTTTIEQQDF